MNTKLILGATYTLRSAAASALIAEYIGKIENNPDLMILEIDEGKKNISIEQVREMIAWFFIKPIQSDKKVIYINEAQNLTVEAQNALLKTLEEPPSYGYFVLTAGSKRNLLETVLSRCAVINLKPMPRADFSSAGHIKHAEEFSQLLGLGVGARLDWINDQKDKLKDSAYFEVMCDAMESVLRDISVYKASGNEDSLFNTYSKHDIIKLASYANTDEQVIIDSIRELQSVRLRVSNYNVSPSLALENFLMHLPQVKN